MLLPFLALSLLSPSVMAIQGGDGGVMMVLCTGDGPVEMMVDLGTDAPKVDPTCDWANAQVSVLAATTFTPVLRAQTYRSTQADHATSLWHPAYDPRNLWARGPPNLA